MYITTTEYLNHDMAKWGLFEEGGGGFKMCSIKGGDSSGAIIRGPPVLFEEIWYMKLDRLYLVLNGVSLQWPCCFDFHYYYFIYFLGGKGESCA